MADRALTGVLLVGGASRRFGSPKALARLDGETLAERGWRILGETCDEVIALGKRADGLELPFPLVDDDSDVRAPLAGLVSALRVARHELCVVVPVDAAAIEPEDLRALAAGAAGADAAVPQTGPLPGAYRRAALPVLERRLADGRLALRDALAELDVRTVELDPWRLANVNAPGDVEAVARRARAIRAAVEVAAAHGVHARRPRILQDWNDTIVHLAPHPIVARVGTSWVAGEKKETYARELAVAAHAAARGGPVVRPSPLLDPGPHERDGVVLAFWEYLEAEAGEVGPRESGAALRALHEAVADYPAPLPELDERLERADAAVAETPELDPGDRALLARTFRELRAEVRERTLGRRVLHGGAHDGNLLRTREGLRWIDLDTVCRGPLEWDLAHLPPAAAAAFPGADPDLLELMRALVGAEVAIWCWHTYGRAPEVDEAARIHLENVRRLSARAAR